jgi:periplasmic divalent cation tolerance protein
MPNFISVHITATSGAEAGRIGRALVEERLAACVNIIPEIHSIYRWQGKVEEAAEVLLIAKTRAELFLPLCKFVKALHSATTPCILAEPIAVGFPAYMEWLEQETAK